MIAFAIASGSGDFFTQSKLLIKSIHANVAQPHRICIYLPSDEQDELNPEQVRWLENHGDLTVGPYPIEEHPMSVKQAALRRAEAYDADWHILLDTDTVFVDEFDYLIQKDDVEPGLLLCPEHGGWTYWATEKSRREWEEVYDLIGEKFPGYTMWSAFGGRPMPPYWNGGVVVTRREIATEWLELIRDVRALLDQDLYYAEQLTLPLLGHKYGVSRLPYRYNYPLYMHVRCPSDRRILHYDSLWHLARILNPEIRSKLADLGVFDLEEVPTGLRRARAVTKGFGVRLFREIVRKQYPKLTEGR